MPHKRTVNQEAVRVAKAATNWPNRKVGEGGKNEREKMKAIEKESIKSAD